MPTAVSPTIRESLAIAFDVDDLVEARRLAKELEPFFGVAKIGLELFTAVGPDIVGIIADQGFKVFLDMKLHDNPTTVERAARVMGAIGVSYLTLHAFGGAPMLRAGVDGLSEGAARAGLETPRALAVTILTGDTEAPPYILGNRVKAAIEGGCHGIVCAAPDVKEAKQLAPRMQMVVNGVRPAGAPEDEWQTAATPEAAVEAGADLLILGRAITGASDRVQAAEELIASLSE
jgi:orotidine-5'-phosphate decarboxylase